MPELLVMSLFINKKKEKRKEKRKKRKNVEKRRKNRQISLHMRKTGGFSDLSEKKVNKNA